MKNSELQWNGGRWWKFDFHTHTPASDDYGKGPNQAALKKISSKEWLLEFMRAGVDCIAITDHNTGAWIDRIKTAYSELESEEIEDIGTPDSGEGLLGKLYEDSNDAEIIEQHLANIKNKIRTLETVADKRFRAHICKLPPEVIDRLDLWFPEDSLDVQ